MNENFDDIDQFIQQSAKAGKTTHVFWLICIVFCVLFLGWTYVGTLDIVSMASGSVIPSSKVKRIQHLEGGIIRKILVAEGDQVQAGQELMILEAITSGASVDELKVRTSGLRADVVRLQAIINGDKEVVFPRDLRLNYPDLVRQNTELFELQLKKYQSEFAGQEELIKQRQGTIKGLEARIRNNTRGLELLDKQIAISSDLLKDSLTTEYKHLNFLREQTELMSEIEEDRIGLKKAGSAVEEVRKKLQRITHSFMKDASEEIKVAQRDLDEFNQRLKKFSDSLKRTTIRSSVDGIVKSLYLVTIGGVVTPGSIIMDIVPSGDSLLVEAQLPIQDIGYVQVGQEVIVKLASQDATRYGNLQGEVVTISPDTLTLPDGRTFYSIRIKTENQYFEKGSYRYQLIPGMQVLAFIRIGQRTVLEYLLAPFLYSMDQAMQER